MRAEVESLVALGPLPDFPTCLVPLFELFPGEVLRRVDAETDKGDAVAECVVAQDGVASWYFHETLRERRTGAKSFAPFWAVEKTVVECVFGLDLEFFKERPDTGDHGRQESDGAMNSKGAEVAAGHDHGSEETSQVDDLDGVRAALDVVAVQDGRRRLALKDPGELPSQVCRVTESGNETLAGKRWGDVGGVADEEAAAFGKGFGFASVEAVDGSPLNLVENERKELATCSNELRRNHFATNPLRFDQDRTST